MSTPRDLCISFKSEMVLAILARRKSMTRRLISPQPTFSENMGLVWEGACYGIHCDGTPHLTEFNKKCRYVTEDTLWVKEAWRTEERYDHLKPSKLPDDARIWYMADGPAPDWAGRFRSSMFLQRRFSRIFLKVTGVRAERLQQITAEDAKAEGVKIDPTTGVTAGNIVEYREIRDEEYLIAFQELWDSINAGREFPWSGDWWVWVISFRVVGVKGE